MPSDVIESGMKPLTSLRLEISETLRTGHHCPPSRRLFRMWRMRAELED